MEFPRWDRAAERVRKDINKSISRQVFQGLKGIVPNKTLNRSVVGSLQLFLVEQGSSSEIQQVEIDTTQTTWSGIHSTGQLQQFERAALEPSQFRLFVLDPGGFTDRLTGHLTKHDLANPPEYYGLSYVWGEEHAVHTLSIDDIGEVFVRPNLFHALRRIRRISSQISLWIDDLCIKQHDKDEKNAQVAQMAKIYQKAISIFIWLGEGNATSTLAKECIEALVGPDFNWTQPWWMNHKVFALIELLNRPWFSRGWVVQEAAYAKSATIYCGQWQLPLDHLKHAIDQILLRLSVIDRTLLSISENRLLARFYESAAVKLISIIRRVFEMSEDGEAIVRRCLSLETLVEEARFTETTDCRDSIYALMSMANDVDAISNPGIVADYSKSDLDVYIDFIEHCVQQSQSLDIICRPWAPSVQLHRAGVTFPSWIVTKDLLPSGNPSFQHTLRLHGDPLIGSSQKRIYNCSLTQRPDIRFERQLDSEKKDRALCAKGIFLGQITGVSTRMANSLVYRDALEILGTIRHSPTTLWNVSDSIWQTLCADRDTKGGRAPFFYRSAMQEVLKHVWESTTDIDSRGVLEVMPSIDVEDLLETAELQHAHEFLNRVRDTVWNRRAFRAKADPRQEGISSKDMVGLVPRAARVGDVICILYGCSVPVVLRKPESSSGDEAWVLVGDVYVNGIMSGEVIKEGSLDGTLEQRERVIKIK